MARKKKETELVEEVTMIAEEEGTLIEEVQEKIEDVVEDIQEVVEDVIEDVQEAIEDAQEAIEDAVEDVQEFFGKIFNKVDPATGPLPRAEAAPEVIEAAAEISGKEYFEAGIQGAKAKVIAMTEQEIAAAAVEAEAKVGGSLNELKDKTFNDTSVGGLVGSYQEDNRNGSVFYRGQ